MPGNSAILCSYMALQEKNPQWSVSIRKTLSTHLFGNDTVPFLDPKNVKIISSNRRSLQTLPIIIDIQNIKSLAGFC